MSRHRPRRRLEKVGRRSLQRPRWLAISSGALTPLTGEQRFFVARWGMVQVLAGLADVDHFLERAGAAK